MDTVLKICYDCNEEKLHYVDKGHVAAYCNGCQVIRKRIWRNANREHVRVTARVYDKTRRSRHVQQDKARNKAEYALKVGALVRPDICSRCGLITKVEAHHADYTKPFDVEWLCAACHRRIRYGR